MNPTERVQDRAAEASWVVDESITRMHFIRYAGASGDFNPIHLDDGVAQAAGYPSVFGHGMFTAGLLGHFTADWLGIGRVRKFSVRFKRPLFPGDKLRCSGAIMRQDDEFVDARLGVTNQHGDVLIEGFATALRPDWSGAA